MRDIFDAVYGLLIIPEPDDPLDRWDIFTHSCIPVMQVCSISYFEIYLAADVVDLFAEFGLKM